MLHNPNLMYSIYPVKVEEQDAGHFLCKHDVERPQSAQRVTRTPRSWLTK